MQGLPLPKWKAQVALMVMSLLCGCAIAAPQAVDRGLWAAKRDGARVVVLTADVALPVDRAFDLWLSADGVATFLAPAANIDPIVGGRYTIIFDPANDPEGASQGTRGARILRLQRPHRLSFEWTMPPDAAALNIRPLPTWVDLTFEPIADRPGHTRVTLQHRGFGGGDEWTPPFEWFRDRAWPAVMRQLQASATTIGREAR